MAQNYVHSGEFIHAAASHPATPASGAPCRVGNIPGVVVVKEGEGGNAAGEATIKTKGVFALSVKGIDASGNSPVAIGDKIYYTDADTPPLSKKATGYLFGKALEVVESAATTTIKVMLIQA
jgi:predicted RecA/RadA family phage recombinase